MAFLSRLRNWLPERFREDVVIVPVVRLSGAIGQVSPFSGGLSIEAVAERLDKAFAIDKAPAVAVVVNSPGGSPVQSRLIFERIRALAEEKKKKVHVFVEDVAASGGYMIACAGDDIIADPSSIVGSIGVVSAGFGFVGLIQQLGIERRVHTSGENKAILDPFQPERPEEIAHLLELQQEVHEVFIDLVRERRGSRLRHDADLFTGLFWTGKRARDLGLVDELGDLRAVLRERYGDEVKIRKIDEPKSFLRRLPFLRGGESSAEAAARAGVDRLLQAAEERLHWSRFGL